MERLNDISGDILDAAIKIHRHFGPGMLESVYERLLEAELTKRGHFVKRQKMISFDYEGQTFDNAFRVDLLVDKEIVVELKATETMNKLYPMQVKTYLVAMNLHLGLLINFGMDKLVDGFVRIINGYPSSLSSPSSSSPSSPFPSSSSPTSSSSSPSSPSLCASVTSVPLCASASVTSVPLCAKGAPL